MRQFDYEKLPESLKTEEIMGLLLVTREFKGRQVLVDGAKPEVLDSLLEQAKYASTKASNQIEGIVTTDARLKEIVREEVAPRTRNEEEIAGYRDVLNLIHEQHDYVGITPSVILQLHRDLMLHTSYAFGGKWKDSDNQIVARNADGSLYVRFRPTSAAATPEAMDSLCSAYRDALKTGLVDPLLLSLRFVFDFVCIHPFNDGNGRMSRLLTVLALERCGYGVPRYVSIEKLIEQSKELYYESLAASSVGWEDGTNDEAPFVRYMLGIVVAAYRELFAKVGDAGSSTKAERVAAVFETKLGKVTKADIRESCPDISDSTIERELSRLVQEGRIRKVGAGRTAGYVLVG